MTTIGLAITICSSIYKYQHDCHIILQSESP